MIRLYDAAGNLLATNDNGAPDGRNAKLSYKVPKNGGGDFYVEVKSSSATPGTTTGEYILSVKGSTSTLPQFEVIETNPVDGSRVSIPPQQFEVSFNDTVSIPSLQGSDFLFNGVPAAGVTIVDGDTVQFQIALAKEGLNTFSIVGGSIKDIQGTAVSAYSGSFILDTTPPVVVATTPNEGQVLPAGPVTISVTFSEPMDTTTIGPSQLPVYGLYSATTNFPSSSSWNADGTVLTLTYDNLPEDAYEVRLVGDDINFQDLVGLDLDGDLDHIQGGTFVLQFYTDAGTRQIRVPLTAVQPRGSLIYQTPYASSGVIAPLPSDTDDFTIKLEANQTITVLVDGVSAGLQASVAVFGPGGAEVGSTSTAPAPGGTALLQTAPAQTAGTYTVRVGSASGQGSYSVRLIVNAAIEEEVHGGSRNDSIADAQSLADSFLDLGGGISRGAVLGKSDGGAGYQAMAEPSEFIDISGTGHAVLQGSDFDWIWLSPTDLEGFQFTLYGSTNDNLYVTADGYLYLPAGYGGYVNAMVRDLVIFGSQNAAVFWQVLGSGDEQKLVVQWNEVGFYGYNGNDPVTFEAVLSEADGSVRFNYLDLQTDVPDANEGQNSTVGISGYPNGIYESLLLPTNNTPNEFVGTGRSTLIAEMPPTVDYYTIQLDAGQSATLGVSSLADISGLVLQIRDASDNVLAESAGGTGSFDAVISDFVAESTGTYYAVISSASPGDYSLIVTRNAAFETEPNDAITTVQDLGVDTSVLGGVETDVRTLVDSFSGGLSYNEGLVVDGGTLYVVSRGNNSILRYNASTGDFLGVLASDNGLNDPVGMILGPDNNLYVANLGGNTVVRFNPVTGESLGEFVTSGSGGLSGAVGLAFGPDGNLYVASLYNSSILCYDGSTGAFLNTFVSANSGGLWGPDDLTFGPDGNLYVSSQWNNGVIRFNGNTGAPIDTFVSPNSGGLSQPLGVRFGLDGNLYVASFQNAQVLRYEGPSGATPGAFVDAAISWSDVSLSGPTEITFDADGFLYVSSRGTNSVVRSGGSNPDFYKVTVTAGGQLTFTIATPGDETGEFVNVLDPVVRLYDAGGNQINWEDDLAAGEYFIEVTGADNSTGEYVLSVQQNMSVVPRTTADGEAESLAVSRIVSSEVEHPWCNRIQPADVSNDGSVSPLDALMIINSLNADGSRSLPRGEAIQVGRPFYDVNRDDAVSPIDALQVINYLSNPESGQIVVEVLPASEPAKVPTAPVLKQVVVPENRIPVTKMPTHSPSPAYPVVRGPFTDVLPPAGNAKLDAHILPPAGDATLAAHIWGDPNQDWLFADRELAMKSWAGDVAAAWPARKNWQDLMFQPGRRRPFDGDK